MKTQRKKIVFVNSALGKTYEYGDQLLDADKLREIAEDYPILECPDGAWIVSVGIDVQPDRLAVNIRAWGPREKGEVETWQLFWGEIYAENGVTNTDDECWDQLDELIFNGYKHACGGIIYTSAVTIDSGDGNTNDAVYSWVRTRTKKHRGVLIMAGKGAATIDKEIFSRPASTSVYHTNPKKQRKADKYKLKVYMIGTQKSYEWVYNQIKRSLNPALETRFHFCRAVRDDYFDQLTNVVKAPHRSVRNKLVWQKKQGLPCEGPDTERYALHAARAMNVHTMAVDKWRAHEEKVRQEDLLTHVEKQKQLGVTEKEAVVEKTTVKTTTSSAKSTNKQTSMKDLGRIMGNG
mgnify:CR=1 FL=1